MRQSILRYFSSVWAVGGPAKDSLLFAAIRMISGEPVGVANIIAARRDSMPSAHGEGADKTAVFPIKGTVTKYDQECGPIGTRSMIEMLLEADSAGYSEIVFDIDSGGGEADGTGLLATTIEGLKTPTRAVISGMCCSAAYWIASACDTIEATENTDLIGCIGVMTTIKDMRAKLEKEGIELTDVFADGSPDKNSEFSLALDGDYSGLKKVLNAYYEEFAGFIKSARPFASSEALSGLTYTAKEALALGLIDKIGESKSNTYTGAISANNSEIDMKGNNFNRIYGLIGLVGLNALLSAENSKDHLEKIESHLITYDPLKTELEEFKTLAEIREEEKLALIEENKKLMARIKELEETPGAVSGRKPIKGEKGANANSAEYEEALDMIAQMPHSKELESNPYFK